MPETLPSGPRQDVADDGALGMPGVAGERRKMGAPLT